MAVQLGASKGFKLIRKLLEELGKKGPKKPRKALPSPKTATPANPKFNRRKPKGIEERIDPNMQAYENRRRLGGFINNNRTTSPSGIGGLLNIGLKGLGGYYLFDTGRTAGQRMGILPSNEPEFQEYTAETIADFLSEMEAGDPNLAIQRRQVDELIQQASDARLGVQSLDVASDLQREAEIEDQITALLAQSIME